MTKRQRLLAHAVLEELANTPQGYRQPQDALVGSVRLSVVPPPTDDELDGVLARLEADCLIHCSATLLTGKSWLITPTGRDSLKQ